MKKILITGGAGFIGSNFVHHMTSAGYSVVVLDALTYAGSTENLADLAHPERCEFVRGRIEDGSLVRELFKRHQFDGIAHLAAESHVDRSITEAGAFVQTNIIGTFTLLQEARGYYESLSGARRDEFRFMHVSTDEVFGALTHEDPRFNEETPYRPNSPYSASKAGSDHLVRAWFHTYKLPVVTTNCSNNYGPRQFPEKLIPLMIDQALSEKALPVYGKGENIRDWIHVEDHCRGLRLALERGRPGESYCFGGNAERRNLDLVRTLCSHLDELSPRKEGKKYAELITFVTDRPGHDFRYAIDDSKARSELGFERAHDFESGLRATILWYLDNQRWLQKIKSREQ